MENQGEERAWGREEQGVDEQEKRQRNRGGGRQVIRRGKSQGKWDGVTKGRD